jgi:hypothetical protein
MERRRFKLISDIDDIRMNIKVYQQIISKKVKRDDEVIQKFENVQYWFYFSNLDIFVPNLFLGYKNNAFEKYITWENCGAKGKESRVKLEEFFNVVKDADKHSLYERLKEFAKGMEREGAIINREEKNITIYEPKNSDDFNQDKIDNISEETKKSKYNEWESLKNVKLSPSFVIDKKQELKDNPNNLTKWQKPDLLMTSPNPLSSKTSFFEQIIAKITVLLSQTTKILFEYLKENLPKISKNWWVETVIEKLTPEQLGSINKADEATFENLDISAFLNVFIRNWDELSRNCNLIHKNKEIVYAMKSVRIDWAHFSTKGYTADDSFVYLHFIQKFLKLIDAKQEAIDELQKIKKEISKYI